MIFFISSSESFNSRPHKEVDRFFFAEELIAYLSIHDLTRRSTTLMKLARERKILSIHDLTRRSTVYIFDMCMRYDLSIHDLTRRSTVRAISASDITPTFQFTTSQGGRPDAFRHR